MSLAAKLVEKGIESIDVSMLPPEHKKEILTEVAELLYNQGKLDDAAKMISKSGNHGKQVEFGKKFLEEGRFSLAVDALIGSNANELIKKAGIACMNIGNMDAALRAFISIGDNEMERFIRENF